MLPHAAGAGPGAPAAGPAAGGALRLQPHGDGERHVHMDQEPLRFFRGAGVLVLPGWLEEERPGADGGGVPGSLGRIAGALLGRSLLLIAEVALSAARVLETAP